MSHYTFAITKHVVLLSIDDIDLSHTRLSVCGIEGNKHVRQRIAVKGTGKRVAKFLHRIIYERMIQRSLLPSEIVDHRNGNPLDNRRENLRLTDKAGNCQNAKRRKDNGIGLKGVSKNHTKWMARIQVRSKYVYLGNFATPELAHKAYCEAAKELHGEFARFE